MSWFAATVIGWLMLINSRQWWDARDKAGTFAVVMALWLSVSALAMQIYALTKL